MRRLLFATASLTLGLSGCFPSVPGASSASSVPASSVSPSRRSPSVSPPAAASPAAGRLAVKTALPQRTFIFQGKTSQYVVYADHLDGKKPKGVLFYLHGDGYPEFARGDSAYVLESFRQVARQRDLLLVAPVTPDKSTKTWWRDENSTAWLRAFILEVYKRHGVGRDNVWLAGFSGGAEEITNFLMAENSDLFTGGGALMVGGGSFDPESDFSPQPGAGLKSKFTMVWLVGSQDSPGKGGSDGSFDAVGESAAALRTYRGIGMKRASRVCVPGKDHNDSIRSGAGMLQRMLEGQSVSDVPCPDEKG